MNQSLFLRLLILTVIAAVQIPVNAQIIEDSLLGVWRNKEMPSKDRLSALYDVAFHYSDKVPELALSWSDSLYASADELAVPLYKCKALNARSYGYQNRGDFESAKLACEEGIEIAKVISDEGSEAMFTYSLGRMYFQNGEFALSLVNTKKAAEYFESIQSTNALFQCLSSIAMSERNLGNFIGALDIYEEYIAKARDSGDKSAEANMLNSMGLMFFEIQEYKVALDYYKQAFDAARSIDDRITMSYALTNMATVYLNLNEYDKAYENLLKSLELKQEMGNVLGLIESYYNIGNYYQVREMPREALEYYEKSLAMAVENESAIDIVFNLVGKSISFNKLEQPRMAIEFAMDGFSLASQLQGQPALGRKAIASQELYKAYRAQEQADSALKYLEQFNTLNELFEPSEKLSSAFNSERRMMEASIKQKNAELEAERLSSEIKAKQNQLLFLAAVFLFLVLIGTIVFFIRNQKLKKKEFEFEKRITSLRASHKRAEEERTRFARDLHDVVGSTLTLSLFNLQGLKKTVSVEEKAVRLHENTVDCIKTAMDDVRRISYDLMPKALESGGLIDALEELVNKTEQSASFNIEWNAEPLDQAIDHADEVQVYKIIKELLSNSTKYAAAQLVKIDFSHSNGVFTLSYKDNGNGVELASALEHSKSKGQGLIGIMERCELMGANCEMDSSVGKGFQFKLTKKIES